MNTQKPPFDSALHESLGMTDQDLRRELTQEGLDPAIECQAIRFMVLHNIDRATRRPEQERRIAELLSRV